MLSQLGAFNTQYAGGAGISMAFNAKCFFITVNRPPPYVIL